MDSGGLRSLIFVSPVYFRCRASFICPLLFAEVRKKRYISLSSTQRFTRHRCLCTLSNGVSSLPEGFGEAVGEVSRDRLLQVVLVSPQASMFASWGMDLLLVAVLPQEFHFYQATPTATMRHLGVTMMEQIPGNTGCIARTCAASSVGLHLVGPLGFQVDDAKLKRAGLDYWPYVVVKVHGSWAEFKDYFKQQDGEKRLLAFTKRGTTIHSDFSYKRGDWLVFGSETSGLTPEVLIDCKNETFGGGTIRIPMIETYVRCLNLSVSVGIALYEASRQLNYEQLQSSSEPCVDNFKSLITEDIFA